MFSRFFVHTCTIDIICCAGTYPLLTTIRFKKLKCTFSTEAIHIPATLIHANKKTIVITDIGKI